MQQVGSTIDQNDYGDVDDRQRTLADEPYLVADMLQSSDGWSQLAIAQSNAPEPQFDVLPRELIFFMFGYSEARSLQKRPLTGFSSAIPALAVALKV